MAGDPLRVKVIVNVEAIDAPITLAQPVVLAVNERVVNALRHVFPGERIGTISISLERIGAELRAVVADDRIACPQDMPGPTALA